MIRSQSYCFLGIITIYFIFFCLFLLPNTTFASPTQSLCRGDQRDALLELQEEFSIQIYDDSYVTTTSWNKSVDCCSWDGVTCDANLGEVISLVLTAYSNASTSLKPSSGLFKLQHLTTLHLSYCGLQGEIPSSIGNLSQLTSLDLSSNHLIGEVPASIGNLIQLEFMCLSDNDLRGNIPTSFANFMKLSILTLDGNQFTGGDRVIPNLTSLSKIDLSYNHFKSSITADLSGLQYLERFFGHQNSFFGPFPSSLLNIQSLVEIDLGNNQFEGPVEFRNISSSSNLKELRVGYNNLNGMFPKSILKLRNLNGLDLSGNNFSGRIPSSISKLANLWSLDLSHNNFGGRVPSSIEKLHHLNKLDLRQNIFRGQVPSSIGKLSYLEYLDLSLNNFRGVPSSIFNLVNLNYLFLSHINFQGRVQISLSKLVHLTSLDLSTNSLQGPIPQWICNFRNLRFLDLSNNPITGSIPQCLKNSTSIQKLILRNSSLSGALPDLCMDGAELISLDVSHNNLVGKLPKSLINCKDMQFLNVRGNKIKDTFPFWLGSLPRLKILVLGSNAFYGPVYDPSAYLGFPSLKIIDISNNNFAGSLPQDYFANWTEMSLVWRFRPKTYVSLIPDDWSTMYMGEEGYSMNAYSIDLVYKGVDIDFVRIFQAFKAIDFSGNRLYRDIPRSIGLLSELRLLNFSGNAFTGSIPPSLANITNLEILDLSQNNLSGKIPQGLGNLSFLSYINVSHNHLEGLVPQSTQFESQNCSSFMGNPGLYGLEKICKDIHAPIPTSQQPEESLSEPEEPMVNWIAAAIAYGPGVFCGLVIGHIFTSYKHEWFMAR